MKLLVKKIGRIFAMTWSNILQYRADIILWTAAEAATPLVALAMWSTVSLSPQSPLDAQATFTYFVLALFVNSATNTWVGVFLTREILNGEIVKYLIRPFSIFWEYVADNLTVKFFRLIIPVIVGVVIFWQFPQWFTSSVYEPERIALAIVSLVAGAIIGFLIDTVLATLAFWIEDVQQIISYQGLLWTATSGLLIPFVFLPEPFQTIFSFLPYRYILSAPIEILVAPSQGLSAEKLISIQIIWIIALLFTLQFTWKKGLKRYAIPGQ